MYVVHRSTISRSLKLRRKKLCECDKVIKKSLVFLALGTLFLIGRHLLDSCREENIVKDNFTKLLLRELLPKSGDLDEALLSF